jgi:hypothetical protein
VLIKLIYALIFLCFTISTCFNQSIDNNIKCSKTIFIRVWDIWYSFLCLILVSSLGFSRLKRQNIIPLQIINALQISLIISFIIFVVLSKITKLKRFVSKISYSDHIQVYYRVFFLTLNFYWSHWELSISKYDKKKGKKKFQYIYHT